MKKEDVHHQLHLSTVADKNTSFFLVYSGFYAHILTQ